MLSSATPPASSKTGSEGRGTAPLPKKPTKSTMDSMAELLVGMNAIIATLSKHGVLQQDIPEMINLIGAVSRDIISLTSTTDKLSAETITLTNRVAELSTENEELRASIGKLEARVNQVELGNIPRHISETRELPGLAVATNSNTFSTQKVARSQHKSSEFVVSGLSIFKVTETTLLRTALAIATVLRVEAGPGDFRCARLLRKNTFASQSSPATSTKSTEPVRTTFAVTCSNPALANHLLAAKRRHGTLKGPSLDLSSIAPDDRPLFQPETSININDLVPSRVIRLLIAAKTTLTPAGFKHVWRKGRTILVRRDDGGLIHAINTPENIAHLTRLYPTQLK